MRVGLDVSWMQGPPSGTKTYVAGLVEALIRLDTANEYVLFTRDAGGPAALRDLDSADVERVSVDAPLTNLRQQAALPLAIRRHGIDLYHSPAFFLPLLLPLAWRGPTVVSIFDVNFLRLKENWHPGRRLDYLSLAVQVPLAARQATRLITLSDASRQEIVRLLHVPRRKVAVIGAAPRAVFLGPVDLTLVEEMRTLYGRPLLSVGVLAPQKNLERLLRAFAALRPDETHLVIVGGSAGDYLEAVLRPLARELGIARQVTFAGRLDDARLRALYEVALGLVYPSLGEGFGLPIVEAMAAGCPVITSTISSMPEVAGDAAVLVDPTSVDSIREALENLLEDDTMRLDLVRRGRRRAAHLSWEIVARETLRCYEDAVAHYRLGADRPVS